jgi:diguanylate cyclase (GGDEF)-like protein
LIRKTDFSLRAVSTSSVSWYGSILGGWLLIIAALVHVLTSSFTGSVEQLVMTALLLIVLELLPLVQGRGHDPQGVVMSTAFVCGMLYMWGVWPAIVMVSTAAVASDLRARKAWWKVLFNPGQYALSVGAAWAVMYVAGARPSLSHPLTSFQFGDMGWAVGSWIAYFSVNLLLVGTVVTFRYPLKQSITDQFSRDGAMTFAVLALSPLVALVALRDWRMLPLLLIPLLLLYYTGQVSLAREHDAAHDALTGLPNRASLRFELGDSLAQFHRDNSPFGLLLVDMDDFKRVNDTLGHQVGDGLLIKFAERLRTSVRPEDSVARLGGDEFAVIVQDATPEEVYAVADRIRLAMTEPITIDSLALDVDVSIGVANCPVHSQDGDTLLRYADVAMYVAKESGATVEVYATERDQNSADRLNLLGELRQALEDDALELYYQPKVATKDATPLGFEALIRWNHPQRGFVPPDEFIPLAERSGIMPMLTERVLTLALDQMAAWRDVGLHVPVAVNISPTDLTDDRLTELVSSQLRHHDLPASMLQLEITERIVAAHTNEMDQALAHLREMGVTISLDDFGTGYSSLLRLQTLPVDELKIDRVFVSSLSEGGDAVGIVRAIVEMAHALGMPAIAEGVETQDEWQVLHSLGCDGVQGWQVARPMPAPEATGWIRSRTTVRRLAPAAEPTLAVHGFLA